MALKGFHQPIEFDLSSYVTTECEMGGGATYSNTGVWDTDLDSSGNVVGYAANPSGMVFAGLLMQTTDPYDVTKYSRNFQNDDIVPVNSKVCLLVQGTVNTDMILPSRLSQIKPGTAYVGPSGLFTDTNTGGLPTAGKFRSNADSDGFVKLSVNASN